MHCQIVGIEIIQPLTQSLLDPSQLFTLLIVSIFVDDSRGCIIVFSNNSLFVNEKVLTVK